MWASYSGSSCMRHPIHFWCFVGGQFLLTSYLGFSFCHFIFERKTSCFYHGFV
jgi:hypothetical protein